MIERTLVLLKPDAVQRGFIGELITRFERVGLKIIGMKMVYVEKEFALKHYPVTEQWYTKVGKNTLDDSKKYNINAHDLFGTEDPIAIGKKVHDWNVVFLTSGPIVAMVLEGFHSIEVARKIAGTTLPNLALPGTIRGDYSSHSALSANTQKSAIPNLVHTSGDKEEANREISLWFTSKEMHSYKTVHDPHLF